MVTTAMKRDTLRLLTFFPPTIDQLYETKWPFLGKARSSTELLSTNPPHIFSPREAPN